MEAESNVNWVNDLGSPPIQERLVPSPILTVTEDSDYESHDYYVDGAAVNFGVAVNAMFRHPEDSDSDTDSESEDEINSDDEEEQRLIEQISTLFDDDGEDEEEPNQFVQYLYRGFESMKNTADSIYQFMAKWIGPVYTYLTTKSQVEMVEDLMKTLENGDDVVSEYYQGVTARIAAKYMEIKALSKEKISRIVSLFQKKEKVQPEHIRTEAALIAPARRTRRRYGRVWKKHVDLSDGGIFSSLNNDSD